MKTSQGAAMGEHVARERIRMKVQRCRQELSYLDSAKTPSEARSVLQQAGMWLRGALEQALYLEGFEARGSGDSRESGGGSE